MCGVLLQLPAVQVRRPAQYTYVIGKPDPAHTKSLTAEPYNVTLKELLALVNSGTAAGGGTAGAAPGSGSSSSATAAAAAGSNEAAGGSDRGCVFSASEHTRHCMQCNELAKQEAGPLLECAGCPLSYHDTCLGIRGVVPPNKTWYCPYCLQVRGYWLCSAGACGGVI